METNTPEQKTNGKAVASLVLGILAVLSLFTGLAGVIVGLVLGIVGIVLAVSAKKEMAHDDKGQGLATAGLVCAIIGTAIAGLGVLCIAACGAAIGATACFGYY